MMQTEFICLLRKKSIPQNLQAMCCSNGLLKTLLEHSKSDLEISEPILVFIQELPNEKRPKKV